MPHRNPQYLRRAGSLLLQLSHLNQQLRRLPPATTTCLRSLIPTCQQRHAYSNLARNGSSRSVSASWQGRVDLSEVAHHEHRRPYTVSAHIRQSQTQPQPEPSPPASTAAASAEEPTETPAAEPSFWVSDSAANQLNAINAKSNTTKKLRVTVESGGCHGFQYKMELTDEYDPAEDILITKNNATIVIDTTSLDFVNGSTLDYVEELIGSSFQVTDNPRAESSCGCKTSFNVKF